MSVPGVVDDGAGQRAGAPDGDRAERWRIKAGNAALWVAIQLIPAPAVAWLIHQRCLWRARLRRRNARRAAAQAR